MRGGHSLSLSLDRAETILVLGIGVGLTLLGNWVPWPGLWVVLGCFSCARDVGLMFWFCLPTPGCGVFSWLFCWLCQYVGVGFCCSVLFGCLCWLNPYVGDWLMFIRCIFVRADASFPLF